MRAGAPRAGRVTRLGRGGPQRGGAPALLAPPEEPLHHRTPFGIGFLGATGALLAFWLGGRLVSIGSILVLVVVAAFLAVGLNPLVEWLGRHGVRRSIAVLLVILGVLATVGLFVTALVPVIGDQVAKIVANAPGWFDQLQHNRTIQKYDEQYDLIARAQQMVEKANLGQAVFGGVVGFAGKLLSFLANTFVVVVLMLYFLASLDHNKRALYALAPASRRERVTDLGDRILHNVGAYVSGAFVVALAAGVSSLVFLFVVGLGEYAVALAAVVMLLDVIPMIGATLGAVIVTAIGFATDPQVGISCAIFYIAYQQLENYVIYPKVMSRSVDIPGSIIVISALVGASLLGVVGALLAVPTAAAVLLIVREVLVPRQAAR